MGMIPLSYYLALSAILFSVGAYGVMSRRNPIRILMAIEIMMNAANINLAAFSAYYFDLSGQVLVTFSVAVAAAEAAVGLAILLAIYRVYGGIDVEKINFMRW
jgi:NADH-quinone oxidoreductase subunit K